MQHSDMYLCIYLPSITGHHLSYLDKVLKALKKDERVIVLTPGKNALFDTITANVEKIVCYKKVFRANSFRQSYYECKTILQQIKQLSVRKVIAPTGTTAPWLWPLFNFAGRQEYHFLMLSPAVLNASSYAEKLLKLLLISFHPQGSLSTIDHASYDHPGWLGRFIRKKFRLIPDPIDKHIPSAKSTAREYFGLEEGYYYLLSCGAMNTHPRKNIMMLIKSVLTIPTEKKVRLVLAGKLSNDIQAYINGLHESQRQKFHLINRFLSDQELMDVTHCVDLVCAIYTHHYSPSGIVLRAVKTKTPVLVPNYHWFKYMVESFHVGYVLDSLDERSVSEKIQAIAQHPRELSFQFRDGLVEYCSETNFQAHWRERIYAANALMEYGDIKGE